MKAKEIFPKITDNAVCLFAIDNKLETRYIVAYFTDDNEKKEEVLEVNFSHFYNATDSTPMDKTLIFDKLATEKLVNSLAKNKKDFLKNLGKQFSSCTAFFDILRLAEKNQIPFTIKDTLKTHDIGLRYQFDDVHTDEKYLYDKDGNFIVPHLYIPPKEGSVKIYSYNNFLRYEFNYKNGKKQGISRCYFTNRKMLDWEQFYTRGKLDGEVKNFYDDGNIKSIETFVNGVKEGPHREFHKDGYLEEEIMYAKNKRNGPAKKFYSNGKIAHEANFVNDLQDGPTRMYYGNGKLLFEAQYVKGKIKGTSKSYYKNGKDRYITPHKNGKEHGIIYCYYPTGQLEWETSCKNGLDDGKVIQYYKDGQIKQIQSYKKGKQVGKAKGFYPDGTLSFVYNYKNDKLNGKSITYYKNGQVCYEYNFKDGLRDGYSIAYNEKDGKIRYAVRFKKGNLVDPYNSKGITIQEKNENEKK